MIAAVSIAAALIGAAPAAAHPSKQTASRLAENEIAAVAQTRGGAYPHVVKVSRHHNGHWRKVWGAFLLPNFGGGNATATCPVVVIVAADQPGLPGGVTSVRPHACFFPARRKLSQSGPPTPNPSAQTASQRLAGSLYRSCRNTDKIVNVSGVPVGHSGKCQASAKSNDIINSCHYQWPGTDENHTQTMRVACQGWIMWQTTQWTTSGPCLSTVAKVYPRGVPSGVVITAWRTGYVYIKSDGTVGMRLPPWGSCDPNPKV